MTDNTNPALAQYVQPLRSHRRLLAGVWGGVVVLGLAIGVLSAADFSSTASILVFPNTADPTEALETDDSKIDMATELRIATSQAVADLAADRLNADGGNVDALELVEHVSAESTRESTILDLTFVAGSAAEAQAGANAFAESYLSFRSNLATANKESAERSINERIATLQQQLSQVNADIGGADDSQRAFLEADRRSIENEISAQQVALGNLITPTIDATVIIDPANAPTSPDGIGLIQIILGAVVAGLAAGIGAVFILEAFRAGTPSPTDGQPVDRANHHAPPSTVEAPPAPAPAISDAPAETTPASPSTSNAAANGNTAAKNRPTAAAARTTGDQPAAIETLVATALAAPESVDPEPSPAKNPRPSDRPPAGQPERRAPAPGVDAPTQVDPSPSAKTEPSTNETPGQEETPADDKERSDTTESSRKAEPDTGDDAPLVVSGDMEPVIGYLQELGKKGTVSAIAVGEDSGESATAVTFALAEALHALGARVLIIDAAIAGPTVDELLSIDRTPGLIDVLSGSRTLAEVAQPLTNIDRLHAVTVGSVSRQTVSLVRPANVERLLQRAGLEYDAILLIGGAVSDDLVVPIIAPLTNGLIIGTHRSEGETADAALSKQLSTIDAPTLELLSSFIVEDETSSESVTTTPAS